jgi:hypothetical protein
MAPPSNSRETSKKRINADRDDVDSSRPPNAQQQQQPRPSPQPHSPSVAKKPCRRSGNLDLVDSTVPVLIAQIQDLFNQREAKRLDAVNQWVAWWKEIKTSKSQPLQDLLLPLADPSLFLEFRTITNHPVMNRCIRSGIRADIAASN